MKKLTVLVILAFQCCIGYAQNEICFIYDAAGNRIERKLCCTNCIAQPGSDERSAMPDPSIFDDLYFIRIQAVASSYSVEMRSLLRRKL